MSGDRIIELVNNSSKSQDELLYRFNLALRTIKGKPIDTDIVNRMWMLNDLIQQMPESLAIIFKNYFNSFLSALIVTSSENGWFIETMTTHKIKQQISGNPNAKKEISKLFDSPKQQPEGE